MGKRAYTVSPGLSVRSEMPPASISGPAEPRPTARSYPSLADGKEPAGLDSTVALMPSFSVGSPELPLRCRSSGISTSEEFTDEALGEQSVSSEEDDMDVESSGYFTGARFANDIRSPPSPVVPTRADSLLGALEPILAGLSSPSSPKEVALAPRTSAFDHYENSPLEYSPSSPQSPVNRLATPEYDEWAGESTGPVDDVDSEQVLQVDS